MDQLTESAAKDIYQGLLEKIGASYFDNDFASFRQMVHVPHHFSTEGKYFVIDTTEDLETSFHHFREYLAGLGVTDFIRTCTGAAFLGEDKIMGAHVSDLIRNGARTREPYEVWSSLDLIDGRWKVTGSQNALSDTSWQAITFSHGKTRR
ncbi:hypothetical protein [Yoonia sp. 2307UL14-13]|uniref:hypothetical protein n=1 Tax=Yoonia sp. 2307UL14-13 TaxID=3126506 RepID=UPI0030AE5F3D